MPKQQYGEDEGSADESYKMGPGYEEMKRRYEALKKDYDLVRVHGWAAAGF
jgi:hypothetical protein